MDFLDARLLVEAAATLAGSTLLIRNWFSRSRLRRELAAARTALDARDAELIRWSTQTLPQIADAVRHRAAPPEHELSPHVFGTAFAGHLRALEEVLTAVLTEAQVAAEQTTQEVLLAVARTVQGLVHGAQGTVEEMHRQHDAPEVVLHLMEVDHVLAQILRRATGLVVVCGDPPGRQHDPTVLVDVVRGAIGRVLAYRRVKVAVIEDHRAVVGRAVEAMVLALAELLENATRYSKPQAGVQVRVETTHTGVSIVIEDSGISVSPAQRERIAHLLRSPRAGLSDLGSPPHFGLVVCTLLARRYGFGVSVDSASPFGGARAVLTVPGDLLTEPAEPTPRAHTVSLPPPVPVSPPPTDSPPARTTPGGLPKRERTRSARPEEPVAPAPPAPTRSATQSAGPVAAFIQATESDRRQHTSEGTGQA